jgi:hypothetical protein
MQKYSNNITNRNGQAIVGASVTVSRVDGGAVTLYSDNGVTVRANPLTTDANGYFEFYAADGRYNLTINGSGIRQYTVTDILLEDPADGPTDGTITDAKIAPGSKLKNRIDDLLDVRDYITTAIDGTTDNQAGIAAAVAAAYAAGKVLHWPAGTYVSSANIPNFHDVKHSGSGIVKRGSDLFYISPSEGQENIIYAAPSGGSVSSDGLSASQATTPPQACTYLTKRGFLDGSWRIKIAAGTATGSLGKCVLGRSNAIGTVSAVGNYNFGGIVSKNYIVIEGADVGYDPATNPRPTPTTIFEGGHAAAVGLQIQDDLKIVVRNILFQNYDGSSSSGGIVAESAYVRTENVHTSNCYNGITSYRGRVEPKGGWIYGNAGKTYTGIKSMFNNKQEVGNQNAGAVGQGPLITFCAYGFFVQEMATGHADYVSFEDCAYGIYATALARVNFYGSTFKRCSVGVRADENSDIYYDSANIATNFFLGTADACGEAIVIQGGARDSAVHQYTNTSAMTDCLTASVAVTGTTASTSVLAKTLVRGRYAPVASSTRKPMSARISGWGTLSGTAGTKKLNLRLGGTLLAQATITATDTGAFDMEAMVAFLGPTSQRGKLTYNANSSAVKSDRGTSAIDMNAADQVLQIEVQLTNSADTVTFEFLQIEIFG